MNSIAISKDPVFILSEHCLQEGNAAALDLFGFSNGKNLLELDPHDLLYPQQPDGTMAPQKMDYLIERVQEEGMVKDEVLGIKADGTSFLADLQLFSITQEDRPLIFCKWVLRRQENDIREELPDLLVQNVPQENKIFFHLSREGDIIFASESACSWFSFTNSEIIGRNLFRHILSASESDFQNDFLAWVAKVPGKKDKLVRDIIFPDGNQKEVSVQAGFRLISGSNLEEGYIKMIVKPVYFPDSGFSISEKEMEELSFLRQENKNLKRIQKVLKKSLERFKLLAEYSPDAIMQFDRWHRHLFVNSQVEHLSGLRAESFVGKTHRELGFPPEFSASCENILDSVFESGLSARVDLMLPNGIWADWFLVPEFDSQGRVNSVITTARDITAEKKTRLKLQKSERKLNDAFEVTKLSSWEYDIRTDEVLLNTKFKKLLGLENSDLKKIGGKEYFRNFVVKEDAGKYKYVLDAAIASSREDFQEILDYRICRPDGEIVHILASVRLETGEDGQIERLYGTSQDITQLRLTEQELEEYRTSLERLVETRTQELRRSEAKLADALRLANLGTWEYDPFTDCFLVSDEVLEIVGTTSEIEGGNSVSFTRAKEIIHPEDFEAYRRAVIKARDSADENYTEHTELRVVRSDGKSRHIYLSIKAGRTGSQLKFYGTLQDITNIRHTEFEKERLNAIIEATSDIVAIAHPDGNMIYMNKAGRDFFSITGEDELQKRTFRSFQSAASPKSLSGKEFGEADTSGTWSGENQFMRFDGVEVPVSQVIVSHKNSDQQVECYSTIIRDISRQKRIEQDLIFKNNELDTFVYRASHDLRGPIATLMGLYNLVHYEVQDEPALRLFDLYNSQVLRLNTITLTLIELTKIKEREFKTSAVDFRKIVKKVFGGLQGMTESQEMLFEQDIEKIDSFISDERLLMVILQNMVENSIKYKRQDTNSYVRVEIKKVDESGRVVIKVSDNGIGIDSNIQNKIFNMFFRGSERSSGSGLGLYILKNAVEKLGGRVTLYSVLYKGTTFKIELPPLSKEQLLSGGPEKK